MTEFATFALLIYLRLNRKYSKKFTKNAKRLNIKFFAIESTLNTVKIKTKRTSSQKIRQMEERKAKM